MLTQFQRLRELRAILPERIHFGLPAGPTIGSIGAELGRRAFLIDGSRTLRNSASWDEMLGSLQDAGVLVEHVASATREPTIDDVDAAACTIRNLNVRAGDFVIGIGGGAGLDLAKAAAAMATSSGVHSVREYLEGVGTGRKLDHALLPILAVPTTAGTGAEATRNAVISVTDPPCKKSLRSDSLMPRIALVDPQLTASCSPQQTAWSGMDAVTQVIESLVSRRVQPALLGEIQNAAIAMSNSLKPLQRAAMSDEDIWQDRPWLSYTSLFSGIALANFGLGMAHGVAAALGAICNVPHGLACATLLPISIEVNRKNPVALQQYAKLATCFDWTWRPLEDNPGRDILIERCDVVYSAIRDLCQTLSIPSRLRDLGVKFEEIPAIVAGSRGNSMSCNPRELTDRELTAILEENW